MSVRERVSAAFCGGAFGDEGKGRIVDERVSDYLNLGKNVIVYRDNGGANAGHTLELPDGQRIAMHLLPSGMLNAQATVVLGKGMVIHPSDLLTEIEQVKKAAGNNGIADIMIDEKAALALDTHRAYENALKERQQGGRGATGRGIAPAYADIVYRHPLRMRDIIDFDVEKIKNHYHFYEDLLRGLGKNLADMEVVSLASKEPRKVGSEYEFIKKLEEDSIQLAPLTKNVHLFLEKEWPNTDNAFVFEKAQGIGLDPHWGVYPDVTASDTTFRGIFTSTEGIINPLEIGIRAAVLKATYMSSVGTRILPTMMNNELAKKIQKDAKEFGATTGRPRDIAFLDLPALRFFAKVGMVNRLVLTHMDIAYHNHPIKICTRYTLDGGECDYQPDQEFLLKVRPLYEELPSWNRNNIQQARTKNELSKNVRRFLDYLSEKMELPVEMITTGPKRDQSVRF
jgi:adenylosuccinate synthase